MPVPLEQHEPVADAIEANLSPREHTGPNLGLAQMPVPLQADQTESDPIKPDGGKQMEPEIRIPKAEIRKKGPVLK
jgi:hypothetical protein